MDVPGEHPTTGFGATLQKGDGQTPENFVAIIGISSIVPPVWSRDTHETTMSGQTSNFRTYIGGLCDGGEISFEGKFIPREPTQGQGPGGFLAEFDRTSCDSLAKWRIMLPECEGEASGYFEAIAVVTGASFSLPMDDVMVFNGTLKVSGRPELVLYSA